MSQDLVSSGAAPGPPLAASEMAPAVHTVTVDGFVIDADTGEILDLVASAGKAWVPTTLADAEWILERMLVAAADVESVRLQRAAILENIGKLERERTGRLEYLHSRFDADLRAIAEGELAGRKERSIRTPFGVLGFRRTQGSIKVLDLAAAIQWCRKHAPAAVRQTESVVVTPLKGMELPGGVFEVKGPEDRFSIDLGLEG